jgi:hypothetical protein
VELQSRRVSIQKKHIITKDVVGLLLGEIVSIKKQIVAKDVVGLLIGEVVSTKKHIVAKNVVGLLVGDSKKDSLT